MIQQKKKNNFEKARKIFQEHNGILRTSQALKLGIHSDTLYAMYGERQITRESRGVYRLADLPALSNPDLVQVALRVPKAVICLISALAFHDLTTQIPHRVYIALPRKMQKPFMQYPPLEVILRPHIPYNAGIEEHTLDGVTIRIYNQEKTIADCLRYEKRVGKDVVLEALKEYRRQNKVNVAALMEYARINKVSERMQAYLEILL